MSTKLPITRYLFLLLPLLLCLFTSCSEDDYHYPSVKLEFVTAQAGAEGSLKTIFTDDGKTYAVVEDASNTQLNANASLRVVCNYGMITAADGTQGVKLYSLLSTVSPVPQKAEQFKEGIKTDPANILSIWMGLDYLNMMLDIKSQNKKHLFHFVEDEVSVDPTDATHSIVRLTLYHDEGNDVQAYTKRAYLSVPLQQYVQQEIRKVTVFFSIHTYSGEVKTYQFDYVPNAK